MIKMLTLFKQQIILPMLYMVTMNMAITYIIAVSSINLALCFYFHGNYLENE